MVAQEFHARSLKDSMKGGCVTVFAVRTMELAQGDTMFDNVVFGHFSVTFFVITGPGVFPKSGELRVDIVGGGFSKIAVTHIEKSGWGDHTASTATFIQARRGLEQSEAKGD